MAVALSLLIVLPTLAQVSGDRTDGRLSVGSFLEVRVADNLDDIESGATLVGTTGHAIGADPFEAKDTYFRGDLYVSNNAGKVDEDTQDDALTGTLMFTEAGAYNTFLITAAVLPAGDHIVDRLFDGTEVDAPGTTGIDESEIGNIVCGGGTPVAVATIRNDRSNTSVTAYLLNTNTPAGDGAGVTGKTIFQGIVAVWDQEAGFDPHSSPCVDYGDPRRFYDATPENTADDPIADDGWTSTSAAVIPARDGDTLTVTVDGVSGSINLVVDGDAPEIEDTTPAHAGIQSSNNIDLGFNVSDDGSGLRYDGESGDSTDEDLQPHNGDGDHAFDEPITNDPVETADDQISHNGDGDTADIEVLFSEDKANLDEHSQYGSNDWTQVSKGAEYALDMRLVNNPFGTYYWQVTATDRVGNKATTDSDEDEPNSQPFSFKVDDADPMASSARTGIGYEAGEGEFRNRSWIALNFTNEDQGGEDRIDASTVAPSDFTVEGHTVMNAIVPSDKQVCKGDDPATDEKENAKNITAYDADDGKPVPAVAAVEDDLMTDENETVEPVEAGSAPKDCAFEPRARIYLELADELASDEKPTIQMLGGVFKDVAGNNNVTDSIDAEDWIAPGVSISITSSSGTTSRAATDKDGSFTVRITSDEDLSSFPDLFFATIKAGSISSKGVAEDLAIATVSAEISLTEKETNTWEKKVDADSASIPGSGDRIAAVLVTATDENGNSGNSPGWSGGSPAVDADLDFEKLDGGGFLVEIDNRMEAADIIVLPSPDPDEITDQTESMNPYIQINFSEPDEYGIAADADGVCRDTDTGQDADECAEKADIGDGDSLRTDSHRAVTITALTLNGEDRLAEVVDVNDWTYVLAVTGLPVGEYTIAYAAHDDVGNEVDEDDAEFEFEVLKRQPYSITLQPGWNLISVPGDPFNPAVGSVIGSDLKADTVLGFQGGEWVTSVRNDDDRWQGTLTDIQGGYGYWVRTTVVEDIETVIPPTLPTSVLPTVPIVAGWNLVGVVDAAQKKVDANSRFDADDYLTSLKNVWRVAYSFETQLNRWDKLLPDPASGADQFYVHNGSGYWLWSTRPGTLVP